MTTMPDDDPQTIKLHALRNPAIVAASEKLAELVMDHPAQCSHRKAIFVCGRHPDLGALCLECMNAHQDEHGPLQNECNSCAIVRPVVTGLLPAGREGFFIVARLCETCREG